MNDEILKFLTWLRDEKKIVLCRALGDNFFNEYVPLYVTLEELLKEYRARPTHWDGTLFPIRDNSLEDNLMPFRCPECGAMLEWVQGDEEEGDCMLCTGCDYSWSCDDLI